ncbi:MAG: amidohydrolase [Oscillospiraceae bacterium]|nr:amidohydrolase [Oscillospiraceae bacterium]
MANIHKSAALAAVDAHAPTILSVSDQIWEFAELSLLERKSAALYADTLRRLGFEVEEGLGGIETAFSGSFGKGKPVIGFLAEFDALSGLSQEGCSAERRPLVEGGHGHGCGHNLLGAGALAAAVAVKRYLEDTGKPGTVIFYGCPGEEGVASKAFLARDGVWRKLDAALTWHPGTANQVASGSCIASLQYEYRFTGTASHAAAAPHMGRSALDAVELMNLGVQFLREHMPSTARIHYSITDAGGDSPNVVQPGATVLYMIRDHKVSEAIRLKERVDRIAQGAALMTDTRYASQFVDGTAETIPNEPLEKLLYKNFSEIGVPQATEEELEFAQKLRGTMDINPAAIIDEMSGGDDALEDIIREKSDGASRAYNDFLIPYKFSKRVHMGSTDVGDVSFQTPTAQIRCAAVPSGTPGHSWQEVSCGVSSMAHKAVLLAGKVLAGAGIDLIDEPGLLDDARAAFAGATRDGYHCPIPADAQARPQNLKG